MSLVDQLKTLEDTVEALLLEVRDLRYRQSPLTEWLTASEAAAEFGFAKKTVQNAVWRDEILSTAKGGKTFIHREEMRRWAALPHRGKHVNAT